MTYKPLESSLLSTVVTSVTETHDTIEFYMKMAGLLLSMSFTIYCFYKERKRK